MANHGTEPASTCSPPALVALSRQLGSSGRVALLTQLRRSWVASSWMAYTANAIAPTASRIRMPCAWSTRAQTPWIVFSKSVSALFRKRNCTFYITGLGTELTNRHQM
jgi:hypothetical protein